MAATEYDFRTTRNEIIERALRICGAIHVGQPVSADILNQGVIALNDMVKSWQGERIFLWTLEPVTISLAVAEYEYVLGSDPKILGIDRAWLRDSSLQDTEIRVVSFRDYQEIVDKYESGDPVLITMTQDDAPTLYTYPVPNTIDKSLRLLVVRALQDWDDEAGTGDFPERWKNALTYNLAFDLCDEFGIPLGERKLIGEKAMLYFKKVRAGDMESNECRYVRSCY